MYSFRNIRAVLTAINTPPAAFPYGKELSQTWLEHLRTAPHLQVFLTEMRDEAARSRNSQFPTLPFSLFRAFETTGERLGYQTRYFARRGSLAALALSTFLDKGDEYLETLENLIWEICNEYTWALPAHLSASEAQLKASRLPPENVVDLFSAETGNALAEVLFLVGDRLNYWLRYRIRTELERRIFQPIFDNPVHFFWESVQNNWAAVCAGSSGMAALLLIEDRERLAGVIERVIRTMEVFLESYGDDGASPEGLGYWQYGFGYYVYFAQMLYAFTNGALDLLHPPDQRIAEKLGKIAEFPLQISLSKEVYFNFSDAPPDFVLQSGLLSGLAEQFRGDLATVGQVPSFHSDGCYRWAHLTRNLFWTDPARLAALHPPAGTICYEATGLVIDRRYSQNDSLLAFGVKAGHNAEPHNHNDLGHFILHVGGENILADLGAGVYTREYFWGNRYGIIQNSSEGHSVPLINTQPQKAGRQHQATIEGLSEKENGVRVSLDLTSAYDQELTGLIGFRRTFDWDCPTQEPKTGILVLTDTFSFVDKPSELTEIFISLHRPELNEGKVVWKGQYGSVTLNYNPERLTAHLEVIPIETHQSASSLVYQLRLFLKEPQLHERVELHFTCNLVLNQL